MNARGAANCSPNFNAMATRLIGLRVRFNADF
jgi:hypothetical protein